MRDMLILGVYRAVEGILTRQVHGISAAATATMTFCKFKTLWECRAAGIAPQDQAAMMHAMAQQQQQQHALQQQGEALAGDAEFERERKEKRWDLLALRLIWMIKLLLRWRRDAFMHESSRPSASSHVEAIPAILLSEDELP